MDNNKEKKVIWSYFPVTLITAIFCCALWGSASPSVKIAYEWFEILPDDTASRLMLAGARFVIAGIMVIIFGSCVQRKVLVPKGKASIKYILVLAAFQTFLQYYFFFMALAHTSGVRGSIINASGNFFSIIFAALIFKFEKITARKVLGCLFGFTGAFLVVLGSSGIDSGLSGLTSGGVALNGEGAMIASALFYACSSCFIKKYSEYENPVVLSGYQFFVGGAVLFLSGMFTGGSLHFNGIGCVILLLYMGFISAGAYTLWGILLKYNPVSRVSVLGFVNPILGVVFSALFLKEGKEAFSVIGLAALVLVSLGIVIVNTKKKTDKEN
ncbi:MAG: DMT family transporter [Lachnospiraceae bacterium]|nr:DMT family transporter [Lachnospiraceae bacterium]